MPPYVGSSSIWIFNLQPSSKSFNSDFFLPLVICYEVIIHIITFLSLNRYKKNTLQKDSIILKLCVFILFDGLDKLGVVVLMCLFDWLSHAFADKCPDSLRFFCKVLFLSFYMMTKNLTRSLRHYQLRLFNWWIIENKRISPTTSNLPHNISTKASHQNDGRLKQLKMFIYRNITPVRVWIAWTDCFSMIFNENIIHIFQKSLSFLCHSKFSEPKWSQRDSVILHSHIKNTKLCLF